MVAAPGDAPAVARHRVRRALRQARDETDLSQGDVAKRLGWSLSKMQRIEAGEVGVSPTDLRALLAIYDVTDEQQVERLIAYSRASRRQRYVINPQYRGHLTPGLVELMQFEKEAVAIRAFQPVSFPGLLQTPDVATAMIARWFSDSEARRVKVEARMERRRQIFEGPTGPEYWLILDESVLKRRFGSALNTAEQLEDVARMAEIPRIRIRVLPFEKGYDAVAMGAFQVVTLPRDEAILYTESYNNDAVIHDPDEVATYRKAFEEFWDSALSEDASRRAMIAEASALRSALDRQ